MTWPGDAKGEQILDLDELSCGRPGPKSTPCLGFPPPKSLSLPSPINSLPGSAKVTSQNLDLSLARQKDCLLGSLGGQKWEGPISHPLPPATCILQLHSCHCSSLLSTPCGHSSTVFHGKQTSLYLFREPKLASHIANPLACQGAL